MQVKIQKIFRIICPTCGQAYETSTWIAARNWLPEHRKGCAEYILTQQNRKRGAIVECPICHKTRYLSRAVIKESTKRNMNNPERIGMCRLCRMITVKPALKGTLS
jgi:uncharacterized protein YlaI